MLAFQVATLASVEESGPWPEGIAIVGGGRWARVLTQVLCGLVPPSIRISVHSPHNAESMSGWVSARGLDDRIDVWSEWPKLLSARSTAVIVANAARDHERAVEWVLSAGGAVLVEKPIALTAAASQRLADLARGRNARFAAAHIFLFARYLDHFARLVAEAGVIRFLRVYWTDQRLEHRYGELKQYDPGLPIFADWLPHVLSIVGTLTSSPPDRCEIAKFLRGGAHIELSLIWGDIPCSVQLVRNGERRQRIVEVEAGQETLRLDFSREPGIITCGSTTVIGDPDWDVKQRPAPRMLMAFLKWAAGGEYDSRLDIEVGLRACQIIDQTLSKYRLAMIPWLIARLARSGPVDDDVRYALSEVLQVGSPMSESEIEQKIERVREQFSGAEGPRLLRELAGSQDPVTVLRQTAE